MVECLLIIKTPIYKLNDVLIINPGFLIPH